MTSSFLAILPTKVADEIAPYNARIERAKAPIPAVNLIRYQRSELNNSLRRIIKVHRGW